MAFHTFALNLICFYLGNAAMSTDVNVSVHQDASSILANVGDRVTLKCFYQKDNAAMFYWYKQTLGKKPKIISKFYTDDKNATFYNDFANSRFSLETKSGNFFLTISALRFNDSAFYFCTSSSQYNLTFEKWITLNVKGSGFNFPAVVQQSVYGTVHLGGSVTLNCTVHIGTCDGEHRVYWFKDSGESEPEIIYTNGDRNDRCKRESETQTHTCVYSFPIKSFIWSDVGTYHCAVTSCGRIVLGNGIQLSLDDNINVHVVVHFLIGALVFTITLSLLLTCLVYKLHKRNSCKSRDTHGGGPSSINAQDDQDVDNLHYAAITKQMLYREKKAIDNACLYSTIKQ